MKKLLTTMFSAVSLSLFAQLDIPPVGGNPRATVSEEVGITSISVKYNRPDVNKREGKIWGTGNLIPYGFTHPNFVSGKANSPWRSGANETTVFSVEHDVKIGGKDLKAGTYGLFYAVEADKATVIFSNIKESWGSFFYDEKQDVLRVDVLPQALDKSVEWLKYEFIEHGPSHAVLAVQWEKLSIPFRIDVDTDALTAARVREQLASYKGFNSTNMLQASQYFINKGSNLPEALTWAQAAATGRGGQKSVQTLSNVALAYEKLNQIPKADSVNNEMLKLADANQTLNYSRRMQTQARPDRALEVLQAAKSRLGNLPNINSALLLALSANNKLKDALTLAKVLLKETTDDKAKTLLTEQIAKLKEGKSIH
jgi:hypothetical protein